MITDKKIPSGVIFALDALNNAGFDAYITGGAVRDYYMGRIPKDFDITTSCIPNEIKKVFSSFKTVDTGIKYGTVTVIIEKTPIEMTTFRTENDYTDNRKPNTIRFSKDICDDLSRRDFTINALAVSLNNKIIDLYGGIDDINNKIIKAIGNADERFKEDALRILRALRFSSTLGFSVEENTHNAILKNKNLLLNISKERIRDELLGILMGKYASQTLNIYKSVIKVFIDDFDAYNFDIFDRLPFDLDIRLCVFLSLSDKLNDYKKVLQDLKFDNKTIKRLTLLLKNRKRTIPNTELEVKTLLKELGKDLFEKLICILDAEKNQTDELKIFKDNIMQNKKCYLEKDLQINGKDLLKNDVPEKYIGKILKKLFADVFEEKIENKKSVLIKHALEYYLEIKN